MKPDENAHAPKQRRSEETRRRIIDAGYALMKRGEFAGASVADIAGEAGCSVGAFYRRFADKQTYEVEILRAALAEGRKGVHEMLDMSKDVPEVAADVARFIVQRHIAYYPIYRVALLRGVNDPESFSFTKLHAKSILDEFMAWTEARLGGDLAQHQRNRIQMAFQMMNGILVNAVLGRPGPFQLEDPAFAEELSSAFSLLVASVSTRRKDTHAK